MSQDTPKTKYEMPLGEAFEVNKPAAEALMKYRQAAREEARILTDTQIRYPFQTDVPALLREELVEATKKANEAEAQYKAALLNHYREIYGPTTDRKLPTVTTMVNTQECDICEQKFKTTEIKEPAFGWVCPECKKEELTGTK